MLGFGVLLCVAMVVSTIGAEETTPGFETPPFVDTTQPGYEYVTSSPVVDATQSWDEYTSPPFVAIDPPHPEYPTWDYPSTPCRNTYEDNPVNRYILNALDELWEAQNSPYNYNYNYDYNNYDYNYNYDNINIASRKK